MSSLNLDLHAIAQEILACTLCPLHNSRTIAVPGDGPSHAKICIIGEAPGRLEDQKGSPFEGPAGRLLNETLDEVGFKREQIFITNIVKCRPPKNRVPLKNESTICVITHLRRQLKLLQPTIICLLGRTAVAALLNVNKLNEVRGKFIEKDGYQFFPTFHPAAILRNSELRPQFLDDFINLKRQTKSMTNK